MQASRILPSSRVPLSRFIHEAGRDPNSKLAPFHLAFRVNDLAVDLIIPAPLLTI